MIEIVKESFQQNYKINRLFSKRLSSLVEKILEIAPRPFTDSRGSNSMNEPTNHSRSRRVAKYSVTKTATRVFCGRHCYLLNDQKKIRNE